MKQTVAIEGGGTLYLEEEGAKVRLFADCGWRGDGLYKIWLSGAGEERKVIGTLVPEGSRLTLRRTLPRRELELAGLWPVQKAGMLRAIAFGENGSWSREDHPERLVNDPVIRGELRGSMLCRRRGDGFCLAVPFCPGEPVPLPALFCLGRPEQIGGRLHLVWRFDRSGKPTAHKEIISGNTKQGTKAHEEA